MKEGGSKEEEEEGEGEGEKEEGRVSTAARFRRHNLGRRIIPTKHRLAGWLVEAGVHDGDGDMFWGRKTDV